MVWALDARLRERHHVQEFTRHPDCILRMQLARQREYVTLSDDTALRPGDRIINLHLWSEQFPLMANAGPTLAWAQRVHRVFDLSLRELAHHLTQRSELDDVRAFRVILSLGVASQRHQLLRIMGRYGFEMIAMREASSLAQRVHRLGENILISMMVLARNPMALRRDSLWRERVAVYLSRRSLEGRYGPEPVGEPT